MSEPHLITFGERNIRIPSAAQELLDLARAIRDCESMAEFDTIQRQADAIIHEIERE